MYRLALFGSRREHSSRFRQALRPAIFAGLAAAVFAAAPYYRVDTIAGSDWVGDGGPGIAALLFQADGIASDPRGNLYISDALDHRIRKVDRSGVITTIAGTGAAGFSGDDGPAVAAQLNSPYGLAFDGIGNLYIADLGNARVRKIGLDGTISTAAGGGAIPAGGENDGSPANALALLTPRNLAWDGRGSLYISDFSGQRVYRLAPDGSLTTAAGTGIAGFSGDGSAATRAQLSYPAALAVDRAGDLYVGDSSNHAIRKISGGIISTIARAATPTGLAVDGFGTIYAADASSGQILTIANGSVAAFPIAARDICFGPDGYLYGTDGTRVQRISFTGPGIPLAGGGNPAYGDGGRASSARLNRPSGVATDAAGNLYIADRGNHRIRRVDTSGMIATIAGTGQPGMSPEGTLAVLAQLNAPSAVTADSSGTLYVADTGNNRVIAISNGMIRTVASGLNAPASLATDSGGNLYIATADSILQVVGGTTKIILAGLNSPAGLAVDSGGNLYFTEQAGKHVKRLDIFGAIAPLGEGLWMAPTGVAVDNTGHVFVADAGRQEILGIDSSGSVSVIAGTGAAGFSGDSGDAVSARFDAPSGIAIGPAGALYIADTANNRVRVLAPLDTPIATNLNIVNAASLQPGPIAPGMLLYILGTGFDRSAQVQFSGTAGAILAIEGSRILVQAPLQIAGTEAVQIELDIAGKAVGKAAASVADAAPALFADPTGQLAANNQDGSLNSASNPAPRGSVVVLYGTGQGVSATPVSVSIGGYDADVLYSGPVDGYPGLWQINARIPAGYLAPGDLPVIVRTAGAASQPGARLWVNESYKE